jgi:hypothetical protein
LIKEELKEIILMDRRNFVFTILICLIIACSDEKSETMIYNVTPLSDSSGFSIEWEDNTWKEIQPLYINNYMGDKPGHFPVTQAKVAYDELAIYVKFKVNDRYVKAVYSNHQDPVYKDSCVEFFFTPGGDISAGYFNLEMNCIGTMLFHHQKIPRKNAVSINNSDLEKVDVITSLTEVIDPEQKEDVIWMVSYKIPFSVIKKYHEFENPGPGTVWRANFYKCADDSSHPHWLTWASIDNPTPDFHRPEFFGELHF